MHRTAVQKAYKGWGMEGLVAKWYASLTLRSINDFKDLAKRVAAELPPTARVLEVAPGPGYFAVELARLGSFRITGLDISNTFVDIAQRNASKAGVTVEFRHGDASAMPFADGSFDFVLCRAAFKNFTRPQQALQEMERVLDIGGCAWVIDLRGDASQESVAQAVKEMRLGPVNTLLTKLTFRFMLLKRAYTKQEFEQFLNHTRFGAKEIRESLTALELCLSK